MFMSCRLNLMFSNTKTTLNSLIKKEKKILLFRKFLIRTIKFGKQTITRSFIKNIKVCRNRLKLIKIWGIQQKWFSPP